MKMKIYLVTAIEDIYNEESTGVAIAGIFSTEEKAYKAKAKVAEWFEDEGFEDYEVFVKKYDESELDMLEWYELEEKL